MVYFPFSYQNIFGRPLLKSLQMANGTALSKREKSLQRNVKLYDKDIHTLIRTI